MPTQVFTLLEGAEENLITTVPPCWPTSLTTSTEPLHPDQEQQEVQEEEQEELKEEEEVGDREVGIG